MIIVSDTSPVTNLLQIGSLGLLKHLFGKIIIPKIVYLELCNIPAQKKELGEAGWIEVKALTDTTLKNQLLYELDEGEAEAIALAVELKADYLLIDEQAGRTVAERYGIKITGLLGLLIRAKEKKLIVAVKPLLDKLILEAGFRINPVLYSSILKLAEDDL